MYVYTFFHEIGHAIVGLVYGGSIEKFVIGFNANVRIVNANYSELGLSLKNIGGMLLPVIVFIIFLNYYKRDNESLLYHCFYYIFSIGIIGSILAWFFVPIFSLVNKAPKGDDVAKFLLSSGIDPLLVSLSAIVLMTVLGIMIYKKGVFIEYLNIVKRLNKMYKENK